MMKYFMTVMVSMLYIVCVQAANNNNINMVTYFPTPYMMYQDLTVGDQAEVGVRGSGQLNVDGHLNVPRWTIKEGQPFNNLEHLVVLQGIDRNVGININEAGATWASVVSGSGSAERGVLKFDHALTINSLPAGGVESIEAREKGTMGELKLGEAAFPACSTSDHYISWQRLTINNQDGIYLTCGQGQKPACTLSSWKCKQDHDMMGDWSVDATSCSCVCQTCGGASGRCYVMMDNPTGAGDMVPLYGTVVGSHCDKSTCTWDYIDCQVTYPARYRWKYLYHTNSEKGWLAKLKKISGYGPCTAYEYNKGAKAYELLSCNNSSQDCNGSFTSDENKRCCSAYIYECQKTQDAVTTTTTVGTRFALGSM